MVDFDVILGIEWLRSCYASLDCRTCKVILKFSNEPVIEWGGSSLVSKVRFISYLKAQKLISKECLYLLVQVMDSNSEGPSLLSIFVVSEFPEVFPDDLLVFFSIGKKTLELILSQIPILSLSLPIELL